MTAKHGSARPTDEIMRKMEEVLETLRASSNAFDWIGFYIMNHDNQTLELGPYIGAPTDHTVIPFGKGICGQVAVSGKTYHAPDVQIEDNYIACSLDTQSELVVPIYSATGKLVAQLDIDSHSKGAFPVEAVTLCEDICRRIGEMWGEE